MAPNGKVFHAGSGQASLFLDTSGTGSWTFVANTSALNRESGTAVMYGQGKVIVIGGADPPLATAEVIDLNSPSPAWRDIASMSAARRQPNATLLPDGTVLVTGGSSGEGFDNETAPVLAAELWNPATETWTSLASSTIYRGYHSVAFLLPDGRVVTAGGTDNSSGSAEIFSPPYLFRGPRPTISSAPTALRYDQTFFVGSPDAADIARVTWVRLSSVTHTFNANQRFNELGFTQAGGGLQVTAPADGALCPPGHYLLFLLDGDGVPSVGKIVRIEAARRRRGHLPPTSVVNGASFRPATEPNSAIASGAIVAIFGTDLASTTEVVTSVPLSTTLGETSVTFNDIPAPLFFVSDTQINAQVPFELMTGAGMVTVQVKWGSETSEAQPIGMAAVSPGIFTLNKQGTGQGAILIANTPFLAAPAGVLEDSRPAQRGEFISIFCTGLGSVQPEVPSGDVAPSTAPLAETLSPTLVNISNIPALVTFSGLAPGFVGLYQVNVQVPMRCPVGSGAPGRDHHRRRAEQHRHPRRAVVCFALLQVSEYKRLASHSADRSPLVGSVYLCCHAASWKYSRRPFGSWQPDRKELGG